MQATKKWEKTVALVLQMLEALLNHKIHVFTYQATK